MSVVRRMTATNQTEATTSLRKGIRVGKGLNLLAIEAEMDDYVAVLMGRQDPPIEQGTMTLMELADAYHARAREIEGLIYRGERDGSIPRNSPLMKFRTGELQSYLSLFRNSSELGSRRLTYEKMLADGK